MGESVAEGLDGVGQMGWGGGDKGFNRGSVEAVVAPRGQALLPRRIGADNVEVALIVPGFNKEATQITAY